MQRLAPLLIVLLWFCLAGYGEPLERPLISEHLTIKDGLSNNFVTDIVQDRRGFIWVATESGLNRFDGEEFTTFTMKNSPIAGNAVQCLHYDADRDQLWIGTKKGLSILDCRTLKFDSISFPADTHTNNIIDIAPAKDGGIWIVNHYDNIIHYDPSSGHSRIYSPENISGLPVSFRSIAEGNGGIVYVGHANEGLSMLDTRTGKIRNYRHNPADPESIPSNDVFCLRIDHYGNVWVGTTQGLAMFDPVTDRFIRFLHDPANPSSPIGDHICDIIEVSDSALWIASDIGGVSILDLRNLTFSNPGQLRFLNLVARDGDASTVSSPHVRALLQDSYGNIWIGNYSTGLDFVPHTPPGFKTFSNRPGNPLSGKADPTPSLYAADDGKLWIGGVNSVMTIEGKTIRVYDISAFIPSVVSHVTAIHPYEGRIILGLYDGGALSLDPISGKANRIMPPSASHVNSLCETPDRKLLIGAKDGLYSYDGKKCSRLDSLSGRIFNLTPNGLAYDNQGKLWVGTYGLGVYVFDKNMRLLTRLESGHGFVSNAISQILKDSRGGMWIAGQDGLGYVADTKNPEKFVNFGYESGLDDIHIRAVQEDNAGDIWLALNSGLARLNRNDRSIDSYDFNDGLPQSSFLDRAVAKTEDGMLWFGSYGGLCVFHPADISHRSTVVPVQIAGWHDISGNGRDTAAGIPLTDSATEVELPYDRNSLRITFAVPDFSQSRVVEYAYMVEGIDKDWIPARGENYATLRNLSPGKYIFKVRARLKNQEWDDASVASMRITINPPLWLTWWARLIYLLIAGMAIYLTVRYYKRRLILKNSLELERRKSIDEKALNDERLRFYTNITHELRTPLTLILGPLEDLLADTGLQGAYRNRIRIIHESTLRLLNLINQILEFRKTETQNRRLTVGKGNIANLVMEIGLRYKELNRNDKVEFDIHTSRISKEIYFDGEVITTVLNNLLSNAVKYTPEGKITLTLREIEENGSDYIEICVSDTGYGIDPEALPHIFDRYYQAKGKHQASGTGIGLALVRSLADLHEAQLSVESRQGEGTSFRLRLLRDNTYPGALHKEIAQDPVTEGKESMALDPEASDGEKPLVLVVEDNESIRDYIESSLSDRFRLIVAVNGKEGLDAARAHIPDIIVSDIMMPEMDGIELCRHIKENMATSHIPVVLLTAKDSIRDKEEGYESGADSYLTKPFSARLLISRINNILEARKMLAELVAARMELNRENTTTVVTEENAMPGVTSAKIAETPRLSRLDEEFLNKFTNLVEENMTNIHMDLAFIEERMNMSHSTLYRKVKSLTGMSGNEFIRKIRLRHGYQFLLEGYNVTEAAYSCGFGDVKHFRNSFKEEYGVNPSQFIRDLKTGQSADPDMTSSATSN